MASVQSVFAREDTLFGVCEALGQDFGFNPVYLRVLFALGLFLDPFATPAAYVGLGVLVAFSRWLVPERPAAAAEAAAKEEPAEALNDQAQAWEELALAA